MFKPYKQKPKFKNVKIPNKYVKEFKNKKFKKVMIYRNKSIRKRLFPFSRRNIFIPIFHPISKLIIAFFLLILFISIKKYINSKKYFFCFCGMGKHENLYVRELISYYLSIGTGKFIFGDNNDIGSEKLSDVTKDYIFNGTVDIVDLRGKKIDQPEFYGYAYKKYKNKCNWIGFFDFDEFLLMHFEKDKNITVQEFLSNEIYSKCESISINWLFYTDNDLIYYDKRPLLERFTKPNFKEWANLFVKSIIRGGLNKTTFKNRESEHVPHKNLTICNSNGQIKKYNPHGVRPPLFKNAVLMHFNTKTAEEYINKITRGDARGRHRSIEKRIKDFFYRNKFTEEKLKLFETRLNMTFEIFHDKSKYF